MFRTLVPPPSWQPGEAFTSSNHGLIVKKKTFVAFCSLGIGVWFNFQYFIDISCTFWGDLDGTIYGVPSGLSTTAILWRISDATYPESLCNTVIGLWRGWNLQECFMLKQGPSGAFWGRFFWGHVLQSMKGKACCSEQTQSLPNRQLWWGLCPNRTTVGW